MNQNITKKLIEVTLPLVFLTEQLCSRKKEQKVVSQSWIYIIARNNGQSLYLKELAVVLIPVLCPHCASDQVVKRGKTENGKQRYLCQNKACATKTFILDYSYPSDRLQKRFLDAFWSFKHVSFAQEVYDGFRMDVGCLP
jgi:hypothetical protein